MIIKGIKDAIQKKAPKGTRRSSKWPRVRIAFLRDNPECAICGSKTKLEVHHKMPFHLAPELELDPTNLVVLCENKKFGVNCHLLFGHCGDYRKVNLDIERDIKIWKEKIKGKAGRATKKDREEIPAESNENNSAEGN